MCDVQAIHRRLVWNWERVCVATAFCRANSTHPFRDSILPLVNIIAAMACGDSDDDCEISVLELPAPLKKEESVNVDKFMDTLFFRSHLRDVVRDVMNVTSMSKKRYYDTI